MKDADLIQALKRMGVQTGGLICLGCGHEHNCGVHGCAVIREAAQRLNGENVRCYHPGRSIGNGYAYGCGYGEMAASE